MNIHDIRHLANCLYRTSPGIGGAADIPAWTQVVTDLAEEIGRRSRHGDLDGMVTDHQFNADVFVQVCKGDGSYSLEDPTENDASWDVMFDEDSSGDEAVWSSPVVLGEDC